MYVKHGTAERERKSNNMASLKKTIVQICLIFRAFLNSLFSIKKNHSTVIGIFSRDECPPWLVDFLQSQESLIREVRTFYISSNGKREFKDEISRCDFGILYHTKRRGRVNITDVTDSLYDTELVGMSEQLGKEKVIVLVDDLDSSGSQEKERILHNQISIKKYAQELILISCAEKTAYQTANGDDSIREKLGTMLDIINTGGDSWVAQITRFLNCICKVFLTTLFAFCLPSRLILRLLNKVCCSPPNTLDGQVCCSAPKPLVVGIFSRSAEENYQWLGEGLRLFKDSVKEIRNCYIGNSGFRTFTKEVDQCQFAILYHTKNHGRVNITNVTDSIYDKELKYLSDTLGRGKVIVVIDDLDKTDFEQKSRILREQQNIADQAAELFLISPHDKINPQLLDKKLRQIEDLINAAILYLK
ncbi:Hypothetical predicted protein [Pelobates cultripes]|uniref:Uncharacterized protein n=1 Tax=Pelobates cultripes TaxID=61616 RepID=A0AAD1WGF2_PELCU|nr:Hypothetical predicted protein [Pelobates cultripes]